MLAAKLGLLSAQLSLAHLWEKGLVPFHCARDNKVCASEYYAQAALMHQSELANLKLGDFCYSGFEGVQPSLEEAYDLYSAANNYPAALFNRAYMHQYGRGVLEDQEEAARLYRKIIEGPEGAESAYPAQIALSVLHLQQKYPIVRDILSYLGN